MQQIPTWPTLRMTMISGVADTLLVHRYEREPDEPFGRNASICYSSHADILRDNIADGHTQGWPGWNLLHGASR